MKTHKIEKTTNYAVQRKDHDGEWIDICSDWATPTEARTQLAIEANRNRQVSGREFRIVRRDFETTVIDDGVRYAFQAKRTDDEEWDWVSDCPYLYESLEGAQAYATYAKLDMVFQEVRIVRIQPV